jgi:type II secretion system protein G
MRKEAFTLIELLVVIAIIGLLASIVVVNVNSARAKARDGKKLSELHALQSALEMYYIDRGSYPPSAQAANISYCVDVNIHNGYSLPELLTPKYLSSISAAVAPGCTVYYANQSITGSSWYRLYTGLEKPSAAQIQTITSGDADDAWMAANYGVNYKFYEFYQP